MSRPHTWALAALLAAALGGCGTTRLVASHRDARIYVDGALVGHGEAAIDRAGFPGSAQVRVERGAAVTETTLTRSFTLTTGLVGLFTAYTGFLWYWQYPEQVELRLPPAGWGPEGGRDPWAAPPAEDDPWLRSPGA